MEKASNMGEVTLPIEPLVWGQQVYLSERGRGRDTHIHTERQGERVYLSNMCRALGHPQHYRTSFPNTPEK